VNGFDEAVPELDDLAVAVYQAVLDTGRLDEEELAASARHTTDQVRTTCEALRQLGLITPPTREKGRWHAVDPDLATANVVVPLETEIRRQASLAERLRTQIQLLAPVHAASGYRHAPPAVEMIIGREAVREQLDFAAERCRKEVLIVHPSSGAAGLSASVAQERDLSMLGRGVTVRALYQHVARYHLPAQAYMDTLTNAGAEIRTTEELADKLIIFDGETCLLPLRDEGCDPPADEQLADLSMAVVLRNRAVIDVLVRMFLISWDGAQPFRPQDPQPDRVPEQLKRTIARLMATGAKDEAIARRLGMSLRTCRRHIAKLMESLGVDSRFQAGVEAQTLGLTQRVPATASPRMPDLRP
jgi:DNA-binding CsgD family transcriptional regulator